MDGDALHIVDRSTRSGEDDLTIDGVARLDVRSLDAADLHDETEKSGAALEKQHVAIGQKAQSVG